MEAAKSVGSLKIVKGFDLVFFDFHQCVRHILDLRVKHMTLIAVVAVLYDTCFQIISVHLFQYFIYGGSEGFQ